MVLAQGAGAQADDEEVTIEARAFYLDADNQQVDVEGVVIRLVDAEGNEVESDETGPDGVVALTGPTEGDYTVTVDDATIPEDLELRDPDRTTLAASNVIAGQAKRVNFVLVSEGGGGARSDQSTVNRIVRLGVSGFQFGLIIAMCAVGLSLIFGTTGLVNFAHGELVTFGAMVGFILNVTVGLHMLIAAPLAIAAAAAFSAGIDVYFWRPIRGRPPIPRAVAVFGVFAVATVVYVLTEAQAMALVGALPLGLVIGVAITFGTRYLFWERLRGAGHGLITMMVVSIGVSIAIRYVMLYQFGGFSRNFDDYVLQPDPLLDIGPVTLAPRQVVSIVLSLVVLVGVAVMLNTTRLGKAMRAVADNKDLAESTGIDVDRVITVVWIMGGGLAALGGILLGLEQQVDWLMGFRLLLLMFAGVTLGGLGTAYGALVGCVIVGTFIDVSTVWIPPELKVVGALFVLILILLVRPQGILGRAERVG